MSDTEEKKAPSFGEQLLEKSTLSLIDGLAGGGLISAGGQMLFGMMQAQDEERRWKREMAQRKKEFDHKQSMDIASSERANAQLNLAKNQDNRAQSDFLSRSQKNAQEQKMLMSRLKILNSRY